MDAKKWYYSKTIWASVVIIVASVLNYFGIVLTESLQAEIVDTIVNLIYEYDRFIALIAGIIALYGRIVANKTIK